jgi:hypothetical protein
METSKRRASKEAMITNQKERLYTGVFTMNYGT